MTDHAQLSQFGLFDARTPRYTSYPTAPQFTPTVGAGQFSDWIGQIQPGSDISLYLHVPFCRRLCWFCACRTQGTTSDAPVAAYVETLLQEIALLARRLPSGVRLSRLHWGGGTPTLLTGAQITRLSRAIFDLAPMASGGEFSVEIDPNEIDAERLEALVAAGMNRASIGVQDFDPAIQKIIGRDQSYELTAGVAAMIRAKGVQSLNADILFGLPQQTVARMTASVDKLLSIAPDRVALYGYAHVPWISRRQQMIPAQDMPGAEQRLGLFESAADQFTAAGYDAIGIDHFARPSDRMARAARSGGLRRNFQGYTDDRAPVLIGLGASSISRFPQGFAQNVSATAAYAQAVRGGHFATARGHAFAGEDILRGRMIEAVMCDFFVSRAEILGLPGAAPDRVRGLFAAAMAEFPGVLALSDQGLTVPPHARPLARMIARVFDAYDLGRAQHSAAI